MKKYRRRRYSVEAVKVAHDNVEEIANWMGPRATVDECNTGIKCPGLLIDSAYDSARIGVGLYVIKNGQGDFYSMYESDFNRKYRERP